jgi:hypothetical protein
MLFIIYYIATSGVMTKVQKEVSVDTHGNMRHKIYAIEIYAYAYVSLLLITYFHAIYILLLYYLLPRYIYIIIILLTSTLYIYYYYYILYILLYILPQNSLDGSNKHEEHVLYI